MDCKLANCVQQWDIFVACLIILSMVEPAPYSNTDTEESTAIHILEGAINFSRVKFHTQKRDKDPNSDGRFEIVDSKQIALAVFGHQIKGVKICNGSYQCPSTLIGYAERAIMPFILFVVDRTSKVVYWKLLHPKMKEFQGKEQQKSFVIKFDKKTDIVDSTENYIQRWLQISAIYQRKVQDLPELFDSQDDPRNTLLDLAQPSLSTEHLDAIRSSFESCSQDLLRWAKTVDGKWLDRPLLAKISDAIQRQSTTTSILLGPQGSGKSALLSKLASDLRDKNILLLAIKADLLPIRVKSMEALSEYLDTSDLVGQIRAAASTTPVVILLDQLDALADLVDLKSGRLNTLIDLVRAVSGSNNVHIVASCRSFEAEHDHRIRNLDVEKYMLQPLEWAQVDPILKQLGIKADGWPERMKELLRTPQHLSVFLNVCMNNPEEPQLFESFRSIMHTFWDTHVDENSLEEVLGRIAITMSEREELWLPIQHIKKNQLEKLLSRNLLVTDSNKRKFGFSHQSVFEYARARAFVNSKKSLCEHVLLLQDGLFVRPLLWNLLPYLRDSDPGAYKKEFEKLWNSSLRYHLKALLIEFLGQLSDPSDFEASFLFSALKDQEYSAIALSSIAGNEAWFHRVQQQFLPLEMSKPDSGLLGNLLKRALPFAKGSVLALVKQSWLPFSEMDNRSFDILYFLEDWDTDAIQIAKIVLERTEIIPTYASGLISQVAKSHPVLACELFECALNLKIQKVNNNGKVEGIERQDINLSRWNHPLRKLLQATDWDCAFELAQKCPEAFITTLMPLVNQCLNFLTYNEPEVCLRYTGDTLSSWRVNDIEERESDTLISALHQASKVLAESNPSKVVELVRAYENSNLLFVHDLLCSALIIAAQQVPSETLSYLVKDDRRFFVGYDGDEQRLSKQLIHVLWSSLTSAEQNLLQDRILRLEAYLPEAYEEQEHRASREVNRQAYRKRLFSAIPFSQLRNEAQLSLDGDHPDFHATSVKFTLSVEGDDSEMDEWSDELNKARAEDLLTFLTSVHGPGFTGFTNQGSFRRSQILQELAKKSPTDAIKLILDLSPEQDSEIAGKALEGLASSDLETSKLFDLILELDKRAFSARSFWLGVASAVRARIGKTAPAPEVILELVERSLDYFVVQDDSTQTPSQKDDEFDRSTRNEEPIESILWTKKSNLIFLNGSFPILQTLTVAFLEPANKQPARWLQILDRHVEKNDTISVWKDFASACLRYLRICDHSAAQSFLEKLFNKYPALFEDRTAAVLIANSLSWTSTDFNEKWIPRIRESEWEGSSQAFGEVLTMHHLWFQQRGWSQRMIAELISLSSSPLQTSTCIGIAFCASRLWHHVPYHERASEILLSLIQSKNDDIAQAAGTFISNGNPYYCDDNTVRVLTALSDSRRFLNGHSMFNVLESILDLVPWNAVFTFEFAMKVIKEAQSALGDIRTSQCLYSGPLLDIAVRLQRMGEIQRKQGMEVFEALMKFRALEVNTLVGDLDGRLRKDEGLKAPRRRRRGWKRA